MTGIVILNYNTPSDVILCIDSVYKYTSQDFKIYIVDNCSTDDSYQILSNKYSNDNNVVLIKSDYNGGFSAGNNIGIKRAIEDGAEYVCVSNPDILLLNDAIAESIKIFESDKTIGIVCPVIQTPDDSIESQVARKKLSLKDYLLEKLHLNKLSKRYIKEDNFNEDFIFSGMGSGCFYVARTDFFVRAHYLDESVFLFGEEDIMVYKLEKMGYMTCITPKAEVFHNHHKSIAKTSPANRIFHLRLSPLVVLRKYAGISKITLFFLIMINNFAWLMKSIFNKDFRKKFKGYVNSNKKIFSYKKREGLENVN